MNIAVVGSRELEDYNIVEDVLFASVNIDEDTIISGGARGADQLAEHFANQNNIPKIIHKPDYVKYTKWTAPKERNTLIVNDADYMIAFWDGKSGGTKDSIDKAKEKGIQVLIITVDIVKKKRKRYTELDGMMKAE